MMPGQGQPTAESLALEKARELREEGLTVIPLGAPNETPPTWFVKERCNGNLAEATEKWPKTPRVKWQDYQHTPVSDEQFEGWAARWPTCNWAILTGDLVVVDADTAEATTWCESGAITRSPRKVITSKGAHFYYRATPGLIIKNSANPVGHVDMRGVGGYVVAPGSVHATGVLYTEEILPGLDGAFSELPCLTNADILAIRQYTGARTEPNGLPVGNIARVLGKTFDATAWMPKATGEPVQPGGRNNAAASLAGQYIQAGDDLATVKAKLDTWNGNNPVPLPQDEINTTIASVAKTHARNTGQPVPLEQARPAGAGYDLFGLARDPRETPPYIIDGLFRHGDNVVLAGPPKSMKSFLMGDLLYGMAFGRDVLGFKVQREHRVAWLQAEMPWYETRLRANAHPWVKERLASGRPSNIWVSDRDFVHRLDIGGIRRTVEAVEAHFGGPPDVLAIDSLAATYDQESEIDNTQMQTFLQGRLGMFRQAWGQELTIFLIHHTAKMSAAVMAEDPFLAIRGASAIRGWYSAGMVMYRAPKDTASGIRHLHFELRGAKEPDPKELRLDGGLMIEGASIDLSGEVDAIAQDDFMSLAAIFERQEIKLSPSSNSPHYAPKVMAQYVSSTKLKTIKTRTREAFETAYFQLLNAKKITIENDQRNRTKTIQIARGSAAEVCGSPS